MGVEPIAHKSDRLANGVPCQWRPFQERGWVNPTRTYLASNNAEVPPGASTENRTQAKPLPRVCSTTRP